MKYFLLILLYFPLIAQNPPDTDVFLFDLNRSANFLKIENGKNISKNPGYDNQPSFYSDNLLIYSRTRDNQTDIAGYEISSAKTSWFSNTGQGSEYSPKRILGSKEIAAVRLDTTGLQRLYLYGPETLEDRILIPHLKVGYIAFLNEHRLLTTVLTGSGMDLYINDLKEEIDEKLVSNVGRSLQKIPDTEFMSYTVINEEKDLDLYLMEINEGEPASFFVCTLPSGVQDYAWLNRDQILIGNDQRLYLYDTLSLPEWTEAADLSEYDLRNITRIAISNDGTKMALAAESNVPPE